ncbi:MAG: hypothetical protein COA78_07795 [Blastopirellula sp.]|nr:MAG: hypothetical protein COA78_07795 [Blastopirellula sp.]
MATTSNHDPDFLDTLSIKSHYLNDLDEFDSPSFEMPGKSLSEIEDDLKKCLNKQEIEVVMRVVYYGETFAEIAEDFEVNRSTVSRIHNQAFAKYRIHTIANRVHHRFLKHENITVNPITSEFLNFRGYSVLKREDSQQFKDLPSAGTIHAYLWKHKKALNFADDDVQSQSKTRLFIRGSRCGDSHWILQQTYIVSDFKHAYALAILEGHETIYEFENERTIEVPRLSLPAVECF